MVTLIKASDLISVIVLGRDPRILLRRTCRIMLLIYMHGDDRVTTHDETAWTRRKDTGNAQSEIGATLTVTADGVYVQVDGVAKPP